MLTGEQMRLGWVVSRAGTVIPRGKSIVFPMNIGISVNLGVDPPVLDRTLTFLGSPFRYLPKSSHVNPRIDKPLLVELPTRPTISISMYHYFGGTPSLINMNQARFSLIQLLPWSGERNILVVAHRDSLRALFGHLEAVEAATVFDGTSQTAPLVYEFGNSEQLPAGMRPEW
jgi:hypothetical protein